ncbi:MAG TPA: NUDIX hydrolase [Blastocatellia bacterium]|jgi:ADP-ribose pyrophosphatase|nr:NUDIX hydrolase [Blastocatellia bacterium]
MAHELLKRDYIYRGKVFDLSVSRFQSAEKGEVDIEIVHHNGGAGALPLFDDGTVALVRQWRYPFGHYSLEIAAGRIEPGHTPEETAARELEEELGYRAREFRKLSEFKVAPGYTQERIHVYLATGLEKSRQNLDEDEEVEVVHITFADALARVRSGEIDDAKSIITLLLAEPLVGPIR